MDNTDPIWIEYALELDELTREMATFHGTMNNVTISMPRGDWENLGRPTKISSKSQEYRSPNFS